MAKNLIIIALVTINVVFIWAFVNHREVPQAAQVPEPNPSVPHKVIIESQANQPENSGTLLTLADADTDYVSSIEQLRAAGMDEDLLRQLTLAQINRDHLLAQTTDPQSPYWLPDDSNAEDKLQAQLQWELDRREQLMALFGADIVDDPLFVEIFKPLNDTLPFLSSSKQLRLDELRRLDEAQTQNLFRAGFTRESRDDLAQQRANLQRQIEELLGSEETLEYELRESQLADRMRRGLGNFDYSEAEFRDIFAIRKENEGSGLSSRFTDRSEFRSQREQSEAAIKDYLGDNRYEEYARSQDPAYRSLQSIGERYGNTTAEINDVYQITVEIQEQINDLREQTTLDREERMAQINALRSDAFEQIEAIAGEDTANSVRENARSMGFRGRFRPPPP